MKRPSTWWFFWRMARFRPWLLGINLLSITALIGLALVPGVIARDFFATLSTNAAKGPGGWLWWLIALLVGSSMAQVTFMLACQLTNAPFILSNAALLQKNLLWRILRLPGARALPSSPGEALSRFRDDVDEVTGFLIGFNDLIAGVVMAVIALFVMIRVNTTITLAVFVPLVVVVSAVNTARSRIEGFRQASREATGNVTGFLGEVFAAVQVIQVSDAEENVVHYFRGLNDVRLTTTVRDRLFDQLLRSTFSNAVSLGTGAILLLAGHSMQAGTFTIGDFALFTYYLGWITEFTTVLGIQLARYRQAGVSFGRMAALLAGAPPASLVEHGPVYLRGAYPPVPDLAADTTDRLQRIEVCDLTYCHPNTDRGIESIDLVIERGSFTVVTGRIGAGKTTLLRALLGLLTMDTGTVRWNGEIVEDPASFFAPPRAAYTPQVPRLFSDTLRNNVLLGLSEGRHDLPAALHLAALDQDVVQMADGLDTLVGPRGVRLSGGQMLRAAAARAFVREPELLVVDDLSSALDVETERTLWDRLLAERQATILAVSHRRPVLSRADRIVVLKDGRVDGVGRLDELLETCEELRRIWRTLEADSRD